MCPRRQVNYFNFKNAIFTFALAIFLFSIIFLYSWFALRDRSRSIEYVSLNSTADSHPHPGILSCTLHTCINVYRCGRNDIPSMKVYVYPETVFVDDAGFTIAALPWSREFADLRDAVEESAYSTTDPAEACLFLPPIDTLNERNLNLVLTNRMLRSLK